jgi:putative sigma-54 modulation protein
MELEFIARNIQLTTSQQALARKKFARLEKYFNEVHEARLTASQEKHRVAIEANIRGKDFEVEASAETGEWSTSLQEVVVKLEEQARRLKQRMTMRKRPREKPAQWQAGQGEAEPRTRARRQTPELAEARNVPAMPMTVAEAMLQLGSSGDEFLVFREAESDRVCVLYRTPDRRFGLVTPEF